jgi:3-oxoacyl-[acyl-carrier-protein] synthase-3
VRSDELASKLHTDVEWIYQNLGIVERRISEDNELSSDLGYRAGLDALKSTDLDKNDLDLIIVATATPDRKAPSTACIIQDKMGLSNRCPAFDINAVCSGFLYAMTLGCQLIQGGVYRNILVIGVDTFSKITVWTRRDCVFFGDGAGAVLLQGSSYGDALFSSLLYADGSGMDCFTVYPHQQFFTMNGKAVYETGTKVLPEAIRQILRKNDLEISDVSMIIPHQPSVRVLKRTAELLEIPLSKIKINMDRYANTASATVPLLLDQVNKAGEIKPNDIVVFAAVGSGWTWGAAVYRWH